MALDFGLGFLVGSLALLGLVLYFTRFRGPSLPHETAPNGAADSVEGDDTADADPPGLGSTPTETCELCGENLATKTASGLTVCAECDADLLT